MGKRGKDRRIRKAKRCKKRVESVHSIQAHIRKHGDERGYKPPCVAEPTGEQPGSNEKLEVLVRRVELGESLWNSEDVNPE